MDWTALTRRIAMANLTYNFQRVLYLNRNAMGNVLPNGSQTTKRTASSGEIRRK